MTLRTGCVVVALVCGCATRPPPVEEPNYPDEKAMLALDPYNPMYKLDANGRVTHLQLTGPHVLVSALAEVGKLTELRNLSLYAVGLTDDSLANLRSLEELRSLYLVGTPLTDKGLVHLEGLHNLRWVHFSRQRVSKKAAETLKEKIPGLTVYLQP